MHEFVSQLVTGAVCLALFACSFCLPFCMQSSLPKSFVSCTGGLLISFAVRFADNSQLKLHRSTHNNYEFSHECVFVSQAATATTTTAETKCCDIEKIMLFGYVRSVNWRMEIAEEETAIFMKNMLRWQCVLFYFLERWCTWHNQCGKFKARKCRKLEHKQSQDLWDQISEKWGNCWVGVPWISQPC